MKKISTPYTFSIKVFRFLYFCFIGVFIATAWMSGTWEKQPALLVIPCVMAVGGLYFMKAGLSDLVDEVFDCGVVLLVRKGGKEERIPLSNIINVNFAMNQKPARISLTLAKPGKFGSLVSFALPPKIDLHPIPTQ